MLNIRMRAEKNGRHVSGAERIVEDSLRDQVVLSLIKRAESKDAEAINIKIETICEDIKHIPCISGPSGTDKSLEEARCKMKSILISLGYDGEQILNLFFSLPRLRGATIVDVNSLERLEPDKQRGIRVSAFDSMNPDLSGKKDHRREAKLLASKVISCPNVVAEICVTDDVNYTFGYIASKKLGYIGITHVKEPQLEWGARVILFDGTIGSGSYEKKLNRTIEYLEKTPILIDE